MNLLRVSITQDVINFGSNLGGKSFPRWLKIMKSKLAGSDTTLRIVGITANLKQKSLFSRVAVHYG